MVLDTDEIPRKDTSIESLSKLPAIFRKEGRLLLVSSALCDAGSAVMVAGDE